MSRTLGPLLDPMSIEAVSITLGRTAFLRELLLASLLSLSLPVISLAGIYVYQHNSNVNLIGLMIGVISMSAITAIPLVGYASLRLNAAILARERACAGAPEQIVHEPFKGPFMLRRTFVAGSVKSRILSGFPVCIGFGLQFALMSFVTGGGFLVVFVPLGAWFAVQVAIAARLFR